MQALILGVPVFDTILVIWLRRREGRPVMLGGTDHSSHRLAAMGLSGREVALVAYGAQVACSAIAVTAVNSPELVVPVAIAAVLLGLALAVAILASAARRTTTPRQDVTRVQHLAVDALGLLDDAVPREGLGAGPRVRAHASSEFGTAEELEHATRDVVRIQRGEEPVPAVADELGGAAHPGGDHRPAHRHRLEQGVREPLVVRGERDDLRLPDERPGVLDRARERHGVRDPQPLAQPLEPGALHAVADERQLALRKFAAHPLPRAEETLVALVRDGGSRRRRRSARGRASGRR